jgi:hypothetical protein
MAACQVEGKLVILRASARCGHSLKSTADPSCRAYVGTALRGGINGGLRDAGYMAAPTVDTLYDSDDGDSGIPPRDP